MFKDLNRERSMVMYIDLNSAFATTDMCVQTGEIKSKYVER